jgi:ABC-type antimicrobial peptide transport system permease subunit
VIAILLSTVTCAMLVPAWRATRLKPVDAIREE